jgi:truncated hemoglobin YjbI
MEHWHRMRLASVIGCLHDPACSHTIDCLYTINCWCPRRLGGWDVLAAAVQGMYNRLFADERTRGFFEGAEHSKLFRHMTTFIGCAVTGRFMYSATQLRVMHGHHMERGMCPDHVDIMTDHLRATLDEIGAGQEAIDTMTCVLNVSLNASTCFMHHNCCPTQVAASRWH